MLILRYFLLLLLFALSAQVHAGNPDSTKYEEGRGDTSEIQSLKILSWNIYLLPLYLFETQAE
jgi:hypothetical protein